MENQEFEVKTKHQLSLVCNFLFPIAPLINLFIDKMWLELNEDEKNFINWYKKLWTINLWLFILNSFIWIIYFMFIRSDFLYRPWKAITIIIVAIIIIWIWLIFSDKYIFQNNNINYEYKKISSWNINILLYYIPIYNFHLWYTQEKNIKSYRWIKESILFWTFFSLIWISLWINQNISIMIIMFLLIIFRVVSLLWWIDVIKDQQKEKLDKIFDKNPEEIFWYIKWSIIYLFKKMISKNIEWFNSSIHDFINNEKKTYSYLNDIQYQIIIEYIIFILLFWWWIWYTNFFVRIKLEIYSFILIIPLFIIIWRYIIAILNKKLPHIPIIHEIVVNIRKIINL